MIFVDASAWIALSLPNDAFHTQAASWLNDNRNILITTDYVIDEAVTVVQARGEPQRAVELGEYLFAENGVDICWVDHATVHQAWKVFRDYSDKLWSFTDCVSKVVMEEMRIRSAFAFDDHFRQFGNVTVVP